MSEQEVKEADPATLPTFGHEFGDMAPAAPVGMASPDALKFIGRYKLGPGSLFWLSDGDVRVKATLQKVGGSHSAVVHWGTMQEVVVRT